MAPTMPTSGAPMALATEEKHSTTLRRDETDATMLDLRKDKALAVDSARGT